MSENKSNPTEAEILIIDDEPESIRLLIDILDGRGYKLRPAVDGAQALSAARHAPPDLILLDVRMPNISGYEICRQLKADEVTCDIPVIFISGAVEILDKLQAFSVGGVDYITKPYEADEVLARIQTHVDLFRLRYGLEKQVQRRTAELEQANARLVAEIVERKQAEKALSESEARYRAIVEDQSELICRFLPDGTPTFVNPAYCRYFGVTPEQVKANGFVPLTYEEDRAMAEAYLASLSQGQEVGMLEQRVVKADGEIRWVQWQDRAIFDEQGQIIEFQGVGRDITERKQADEELFRREQAFRALAENAPDIIARFDRDLRHIYVNKAIEAATGLAPQAFIGKSNAELNMPAEQLTVWNETTREILETGQEKMLEFSFPTPTGDKYFQSRLVPEYAQDGSAETVLVVSRDITGQKQIEQELRNHQQHLEELVAERTAELTQANEQLTQEIEQRKKAEAELKQRNQELLMLQAAGEAVASSLELRDVLDTVTDQLMNLLDVDGCTISNWERSGNILQALAEHSPKFWFNLDASATEYDLAQYPLTKQVLAERRPAQVHLSQPDADPAELSLMQKLGTKSLLMLPMVSKGEVLGLVELSDSRWERPFTEPQIKIANLLANQTANAIQNARLYQQAQHEIKERRQAEGSLRANQAALQTANRSLERHLDELAALNLIAQTMTTVIDLREALEIVAGTITRMFSAHGTSFSLLNDARSEISRFASFEHGALPSPLGQTSSRTSVAATGLIFPVTDDPLVHRLFEEGQATIISHAQTDPSLVSMHELVKARGVHSLVLVPLIVRGTVIGLMAITSNQAERVFTPDDLNLGETIAGQIGGAIETARLFDEERRQRRMAESLRQVALVLNSSLDQKTVLTKILENLSQVIKYDRAALFLKNDQSLEFWDGVNIGARADGSRLPLIGQDPIIRVFNERQPLVFDDIQADSPRQTWEQHELVQSWMGVPLIVGQQTIGVLTTDCVEAAVYNAEAVQTLQIFANQAAVAIENARLFERAQELAAADERARLARELHDAVTQSLFTASLIAEGLPRVWAKSEELGQQGLEELVRLTQGAMAEMRTLLLELRPAAIIEKPLDQLLQQLTKAMSNRIRVPITVDTDGSCILEPELQLVLYRIAQEALNNIIKHAQASQVQMILDCRPQHGALRIVDDGRGFDPNSPPPEAMGLGIMAERAMEVGARLNIESGPGLGTTIEVTWPQVGQAS